MPAKAITDKASTLRSLAKLPTPQSKGGTVEASNARVSP